MHTNSRCNEASSDYQVGLIYQHPPTSEYPVRVLKVANDNFYKRLGRHILECCQLGDSQISKTSGCSRLQQPEIQFLQGFSCSNSAQVNHLVEKVPSCQGTFNVNQITKSTPCEMPLMLLPDSWVSTSKAVREDLIKQDKSFPGCDPWAVLVQKAKFSEHSSRDVVKKGEFLRLKFLNNRIQFLQDQTAKMVDQKPLKRKFKATFALQDRGIG
ncbi:hypothetical protein HPP92_023326 [Vanilla planifolia]|uniref:Uncharacterized protein n=1 Tax=Vanilla planifolia TaxID=51239 RepID=A0A835PWE0_VANPL|nr:hypothetical protein HPP92_023326 [Vanilla planifolia]